MYGLRSGLVFVVLLGMIVALPVRSAAQVPDSTDGSILNYRYRTGDGKAAPYVATPQPVVDSMLALAGVTSEDVVYDLGSGDGRIPIAAAKTYGARGVGIEIDSALVTKARTNAKEAGVSGRVAFRRADLFEVDISEATVVTLYLLPAANLKLRSKLLQELEPGTRVVAHDFHMEEWSPIATKKVGSSLIFLWRIPEELPDFVEQEK